MAVVTSNTFDVTVTAGSYVATHYVAPFAEVTGATSDYDVQNSLVFSNATSSGSPCTLACAMANATAGHQVQCAPGVIIGSTSGPGHRYLSDFMPTNSGILGDPIVFFAQYPAVANHGSTELYTEMRKQNAEGSTMGAGGSDYIVFDGFYFDENFNLPANDGGTLILGSGSTGIEARRCSFLRTGASDTHGAYNTGANKNPVFLQRIRTVRV